MLSLPTRKQVMGFTIIELMITILIAGILASIALPSFQNSLSEGKSVRLQNRCKMPCSLREARQYVATKELLSLWVVALAKLPAVKDSAGSEIQNHGPAEKGLQS